MRPGPKEVPRAFVEKIEQWRGLVHIDCATILRMDRKQRGGNSDAKVESGDLCPLRYRPRLPQTITTEDARILGVVEQRS